MKALLVVDYQYDFVEGSLGFKEAKELESIIEAKIKECLKGDCDLIFTLDTHDDNYLNTQEGKRLPIKHCLKGTKGHQLYGQIKNYENKAKVIFSKNTFGSLELGEYLLKNNYQEVEICGLVTNMCVLANAVIAKTALPESRIVVAKDAVMSFDEKLHDKTLKVLEAIHVDII
ncbi:MAG: cysteine hydrolase [Acholeplasmataceae bacterium]|jgi:nicotinamidase-related amidase|nr:cysteine hydrolase [Acholeplasmataceae bacterium]